MGGALAWGYREIFFLGYVCRRLGDVRKVGGASAWGCVGVLFLGERLRWGGGRSEGVWLRGLGLSGDIFSGVRLPWAGGGFAGLWRVGLGLCGVLFSGERLPWVGGGFAGLWRVGLGLCGVLPGRFVWGEEWATYKGDERALIDEQRRLTRRSEPSAPPTQQELFAAFSRPLLDPATSFIRQYYRRFAED